MSNANLLWTNEDIDKLLEAFLVKALPFEKYKRVAFLNMFPARSWNSITTMLWKLGVNYPRKSVREYVANDRTFRTGEFTKRDYILMAMSFSSNGRKNNAHSICRLATILGRTEFGVSAEVHRLASSSLLLSNSVENVPKIVCNVLRRNLEYFMKGIK